MPLILITLMGVIYLCLFIHNRAWLTAAAYEAAVDGSLEGSREEGDASGTASAKARNLGSMGFFALEDIRFSAAGEGSTVKVTYEASTNTGILGQTWDMKVTGKEPVADPVKWIRRVKGAADALRDVTD